MPPQACNRHGAGVSLSVESNNAVQTGRRSVMISSLILISSPKFSHADDFVESKSGLRYFDIKLGQGETPTVGDTCIVHWAGYTEGYQGKRRGNSSIRDEPFEFVLGKNQAIPAFEEACLGMAVGGIRRIQIPGNHPELSYARDRSKRFSSEDSGDSGFFRYAKGPQPFDLGGQRALDFVLDNNTLQDFNRTLLFDVKLLNIRKGL